MSQISQERRDINKRPFQGATESSHGNPDAPAAPMQSTGAPQPGQRDAPPDTPSPDAAFKELSAPTGPDARNDIDLILDIPIQLTVELGRTKIPIRDLLRLAQGSVVELNGLAGEPMAVLVNGCLVAQGEIVVINDKFGIRLTDVITPSERIRKLNR